MNKFKKSITCLVFLMVGIVGGLWGLRKSTAHSLPYSVKTNSLPNEHSSAFSPQDVTRQDASAISSTKTGATLRSGTMFATMGILERNAFLKEIAKLDLTSIWKLWFEAGSADHDLMKQGAIASTLAYAMRENVPSPELLQEMRQFISDNSNSKRDRAELMGIFGVAATNEAADFLIFAASSLPEKDMKQAALSGIEMVGALRGDGMDHEERASSLDRAWRESKDQELLIYAAVAMAKIGAPSSIEMLLSSALANDGKDTLRKSAAEGALGKVYTKNAVLPVATFLAKQSPSSSAARLAGNILVGIGDATAGQALIDWVKNADESAAPLVSEFTNRTATPAMFEIWKSAINPAIPFKSESNRKAISIALEEHLKGTSH